jgi:hypothetical protein
LVRANAERRSRDAIRTAARSATRTRSFSSYWRGTRADLEALRAGLAPLPETALELKTIARQLGAPDSDIKLGLEASEATVKGMDLTPYRIVYFATHGLVAGDLKNLAEPALALTLPNEPTELDDGLLTASEVAQLKLTARVALAGGFRGRCAFDHHDLRGPAQGPLDRSGRGDAPGHAGHDRRHVQPLERPSGLPGSVLGGW